MATLERLREVGRIATEHFNCSERWRRHEDTKEAHFRFYRNGLTLWINPVPVPLTRQHARIRAIRPFDPYDKPAATHGADFELYMELVRFFKHELGHWAAWSRDWIKCDHSTHHDAAHAASRLRWALKIEPNGQIEVKAYQDSHMGPGRTNGSRCSIETHNYESLGDHERLWWRYVTWRLRGWLQNQYFKDRSEPHFDDPEEQIEARCRMSWHWQGEDTIYTPRKLESYNDRDYNSEKLVNGDVKAFIDCFTKRVVIGKAFHNTGNMWWIAAGGRVFNVGSSQLFDWNPCFAVGRNRRWMTSEERLGKLKRVQALLVKGEEFERAAAVRDQIRARTGSASGKRL